MYVGTTTDTYIPESCARALFKLCGHVCVLLLYLAVCVWNHLVCAILSFAVLDPSVQKHIQCGMRVMCGGGGSKFLLIFSFFLLEIHFLVYRVVVCARTYACFHHFCH